MRIRIALATATLAFSFAWAIGCGRNSAPSSTLPTDDGPTVQPPPTAHVEAPRGTPTPITSPADQPVRIQDFTILSDAESLAVKELCRSALNEFFNRDIVAWQETTYYIMPDDNGSASPASVQRLNPPVKVLSVLGHGFSSKEALIRTGLKTQLAWKETSVNGRSYRIGDASIFVEAGAGGGSADDPIDKVTIFPRQVRISGGTIRNHGNSIVTALITTIMSGRTLNNNQTMLISIDKGSDDGVYIGLVGYFRIHKAAVNEFTVQEVGRNTAIMEGWYYPNIHEKANVLLGFGKVSSQDVWDYIERERIEAPPWEEFSRVPMQQTR